jgi:hypothetical protein
MLTSSARSKYPSFHYFTQLIQARILTSYDETTYIQEQSHVLTQRDMHVRQ